MKISCIMFISQILIDLCPVRQRIRIKKYFSRYCLQCFSSEKVLQEHKNVCLKINGKQIVKLRNGSIKLKNYVKQLAVPFKIFAHFEPALKGFQRNDNNNASYTKK